MPPKCFSPPTLNITCLAGQCTSQPKHLSEYVWSISLWVVNAQMVDNLGAAPGEGEVRVAVAI
jgi:hypothetical protein